MIKFFSLFKLIAFLSFLCQLKCEVCVTNQGFESTENLTPAYLVATNDQSIDINAYPIGKNPTSYLVNASNTNLCREISNITENHIPVIYGADVSQIPFNLSDYLRELKTENFGRNVIIGDNIPTTMNLGHDFGTINGLVIIANMQTRGRGNGNTPWVSPRGDVYMNINLKMRNTKRAKLLPALCALSMIKAVTSTKNGNYSKLPMQFSWPISVVWVPTSLWISKIGGVLSEKIDVNETVNWYTTGCGLRVNSHLVYTVSTMINAYNSLNPNDKLQQLDIPKLIARSVNYFEKYLPILENSPELFRQLILENWVNYKQKVVVNVNSEIIGLSIDGSIQFTDNNGFDGFLEPNPLKFGFEPKYIII